MPFHVGNGCFPAAISDSRINRIARSDTSPEMSTWGKIKAFFCRTHKSEALECIRKICHPPAGTTREDVADRFEQLRMLAYPGCEENIQSGRHGDNHFCILDANNREMLSVTFDDTGASYTVGCEGHRKVHDLTMVTQNEEECAEHTEGESGAFRTTHPPATTAPQTAEDYEAVWSAWERAAPPGEAAYRATVVREMSDCQYCNSTTLNLRNLNIASLPAHLPPRIQHIQISQLPLTSLPALPLGLKELIITNTPLTSLPALPHELKELCITGTPLTSLPALPRRLRRLMVNGTPLTSLPALPRGLKELFITGTPLTSLPALPRRLRRLMVNGTRLTSLPESIAGLSREASVTLRGNSLSERTLQALRDMTSAPDYSGPLIAFDMAGPSVPRETRALYLPVADWLVPVKGGDPTPADRWQAFGREDDAASFSRFLDRLSDTENVKKDSGFKTQISSWLTQLAGDDELRAKTFAMATEATSSCEDRVTLALNQMKNVQLVHDAEKGAFDENLPELASVGREMFCLEKLEKIAREKVKTLRFVDEIEVYLGYQNKLKEQLGLTSVTAEMRFFGVSHITESDLQVAEIQVKTAENSQFGEWILQWEPLRSVLKRTEPERWGALSEKKISVYNDTYRALSDTELKPAGLVGNEDAERTIGARAMESAEKAFLDSLRPLADKMLDRYLKARWS